MTDVREHRIRRSLRGVASRTIVLMLDLLSPLKLLLCVTRRFTQDRRAGIAVLFGLAAPVLLLLIGGGVEVAEVFKAKRELQWDVDTAALNGARELGTDQSNATATRALNFATSLATRSTPRWTVQTTASIDASTASMTVSQAATRPSFFGSLLPPGGWHLRVTSTAISNAKTPLCVLGLQTGGQMIVSLTSNSQINAAACLVQSDSDLMATGSSGVQAAAVRTVGAASGAISPAPITDAPAIVDPFSSLAISVPSCTDQGISVQGGGTAYYPPGVHCGTIQVKGSASLVLSAGDHYFLNTTFDLVGNASVTGTDVVLVFSGSTSFGFKGNASLSFDGRQSGPYAGFVLVTDRDYTGTFEISTSSAHRLHGTIYVPNGTLLVSGSGNKVADQSPWTVVVAKTLKTDGSANLLINSNYSSSSVPVPAGVGNSGGASPHLLN